LAGARDLRRLQITWSLYGLVGFGAVTGLVFIGSRGGTSGAALAAFAVSTFALGSLCGTLLAGRFKMTRVPELVAGGLLVFSIGALLVATRWPPAVLAGALGIGAGEGFFLVIWLTRRAQATPERLIARVVTVSAVLARIVSGVAVTWTALALGWLGGSGAFVIAGALGIVLAIWTLFVGLRGVGADTGFVPDPRGAATPPPI
jgi:hypothetical protein